jgi:hypothetical protein
MELVIILFLCGLSLLHACMSLSLLSSTGLLRRPLKAWSLAWKLNKKLKKLLTHNHLVTWVRTANRWIVVPFLTWTRDLSPKLPDRLRNPPARLFSGYRGGPFPYCEGLGSLIWPFNLVKRRSFTCVELPCQSPVSCHGSSIFGEPRNGWLSLSFCVKYILSLQLFLVSSTLSVEDYT